MAISKHILLFLFVLIVAVHADDSELATCSQELCTEAYNDQAITCYRGCEVDSSVIEAMSKVFGHKFVTHCLTPCLCAEDYVYPSKSSCRNIQLFSVVITGRRCYCNRDPKAKNRSKRGATTKNPWENWCKYQCAQGLGGSACYCDIIP